MRTAIGYCSHDVRCKCAFPRVSIFMSLASQVGQQCFLKKKSLTTTTTARAILTLGAKRRKKTFQKQKKKNHVYVRICMYKKKTGEFFSFLPQLREEEEVTWSKLKREKKRRICKCGLQLPPPTYHDQLLPPPPLLLLVLLLLLLNRKCREVDLTKKHTLE